MRIIPTFLFFCLPVLAGTPCDADQVSSQSPASMPYLEKKWTEDGGARPYWNNVKEPQNLHMGNSKWVDPALVPPLNLGREVKTATSKKKAVRKPAKAAVKTDKSGVVQANSASGSIGKAKPLTVEPALPPQSLNADKEVVRTPAPQAGARSNASATENAQKQAVSVNQASVPPANGKIPDKLGIYDNTTLVAPPPLY